MIKRLNTKQKRILVQFSVSQKQQVVLFATQNKHMTNLAVAEKFSKEFNLRIAPQTLSGWLKDKSKYLNIEESNDFNIRLRNAKYPELEECLAGWYSYQVSKNISVSDEMLLEKAKDYFGPLCDVDEAFKYSIGWLNNFKKRHHITLQTIAGESIESKRSGDLTDEEIGNFCSKKIPSEEHKIENELEKTIPTLAEAKSAYQIIYDRLTQSKDFNEKSLEILLQIEDLLNKNNHT